MKKFLKWFFIITFSVGILSGVYTSLFTDETDIAKAKLNDMFNQLEKSPDLGHTVKLYMQIDTLKQQFNLPEIQRIADSLIARKDYYKKVAEKNHINLFKSKAYLVAVKQITSRLKAPSQSKIYAYANKETSVNYDGLMDYAVSVRVDAPNSYGVMLTQQWKVILREVDGGFKLIYMGQDK